MEQDIRWKQRFQNFQQAFAHLQEAVIGVSNPSDLEKEGTIQRFEFTHELAWKVMKDFLEDKGIMGIIGSKDATRHAFQNGIITDGAIWMEMIASRNQTVHTYHEAVLEREYDKITRQYFNLFEQFKTTMQGYL